MPAEDGEGASPIRIPDPPVLRGGQQAGTRQISETLTGLWTAKPAQTGSAQSTAFAPPLPAERLLDVRVFSGRVAHRFRAPASSLATSHLTGRIRCAACAASCRPPVPERASHGALFRSESVGRTFGPITASPGSGRASLRCPCLAPALPGLRRSPRGRNARSSVRLVGQHRYAGGSSALSRLQIPSCPVAGKAEPSRRQEPFPTGLPFGGRWGVKHS